MVAWCIKGAAPHDLFRICGDIGLLFACACGGRVTIVHAHAFHQDEGVPFHTHSQAEFQLYHVLSSLNSGDDVVPHFIFGALPVWVEAVVPVFVCEGFAVLPPSDVSLRAPPVF